MRTLRVVAYAINGSGLGHLTRVLAVLRWARRLARFSGYRMDAYVLTSSEGCALAFEEGFAAFKIPSKTSIRDAGIPKPDYLRLAKQWVWHSLGLIDPDILLVDTFPGGSFGELLHALDGPRARVFIFRAMRDEFARQDSFRSLLPLYDRILVPDEPGSAPQTIDPALRSKVERLGPILLRSRDELHERAVARRRLGIPDGAYAVWIGAGGGGDPTASGTLRALVEAVLARPQVHLVIGAGPLFRGEPMRGPRITWMQSHRAVEDFPGLDFAFSAAGFNSFHELLHAGVPSAFFAQEKIADEQQRRVIAAAAAGAALALDTDERGVPTQRSLDDALDLLFDPAERARLSIAAADFVPINFARDAAYEMLSTVVARDTLDDAMDIGTSRLFRVLGDVALSSEDFDRMYSAVERVRGLDPADREAVCLRLLTSGVAPASTVARLFPLVASRFVADDADAFDDLLERELRLIAALAGHEDERAALALLRMLPVERGPRTLAICDLATDFLEKLGSTNDSIWRGMSVLSRHQGDPGKDRDIKAALEDSIAEVQSDVQRKTEP